MSNLRLAPASSFFDISGSRFGLGRENHAIADVPSVLQRLHDLRRPKAFRVVAVNLEALEGRHRNSDLGRESSFGLVDRERLRAFDREWAARIDEVARAFQRIKVVTSARDQFEPFSLLELDLAECARNVARAGGRRAREPLGVGRIGLIGHDAGLGLILEILDAIRPRDVEQRNVEARGVRQAAAEGVQPVFQIEISVGRPRRPELMIFGR